MDNPGTQPDQSQVPQPAAVVNVNTAMPSPWIATPLSPPSQTPTTPLLTEPPLVTKKNGSSPMLLGLIALVLVGGVAGMTFMISKGISNQQAVAPTAPNSEPQAFEPEPTVTVDEVATDDFDPGVEADCTNFPDTAPYGNKCLPTTTDLDGNVVWVNDPNPE